MTDTLGAHLARLKQETNGSLPPHDAETGELVPSTDLVPVAAERPAPAPVFGATPPKVVGGLPYASTYMRLAKTIAGTEMVPVAFRGRDDAVMAAMLRGFEMGLPPMQSLDSFNVIQGKVGLTAEAMRALIIGAGHQFILETGPESAVVTCHRADWPDDKWVTVDYTMADARVAQLTGKDSWRKNPQAMLDARATSKAGRRYFPDVLAGMSYTPEEIADFSQDRNPAPAQPEAQRPIEPRPPNAPDRPIEPAPAQQGQSVTVTQSSPQEPVGDPEPAPSPQEGAPLLVAHGADPAPVAEAKAAMAALDVPVAAAPAPAKRAAKKAAAPREPGEVDVRRELIKGLNEVIKSLPTGQAPLVRAFLAQHGMAAPAECTQDQLLKATNLAAGWPTSAETWRTHSAGTEDTTGRGGLPASPAVVEAEVVEDDETDDDDEGTAQDAEELF